MATADTTTQVARPPQMSANPLRRIGEDVLAEWRGRGKFPPGDTDFSRARTLQIARDPLPIHAVGWPSPRPGGNLGSRGMAGLTVTIDGILKKAWVERSGLPPRCPE